MSLVFPPGPPPGVNTNSEQLIKSAFPYDCIKMSKQSRRDRKLEAALDLANAEIRDIPLLTFSSASEAREGMSKEKLPGENRTAPVSVRPICPGLLDKPAKR